MNIACIKNNIVTNTVVFESLEMAQEFFNKGLIPNTDTVVELQEGFGINDSYIDETFSKQEG